MNDTPSPAKPAAAAPAANPGTGRGYYQLIEGGDGAFRFTLRAGNHETILESVVFWTRQAALQGVETLRQVGEKPASFRTITEDDGRVRFEVVDDQGRRLASSTPYATRSGLTAGMASVRRHCPSTMFRGLVFRTTVAS